MFIDKTLLQLMGTKKGWSKLWSCIPLDRFDKEVRLILSSLNKYWRDTEDTDQIDIEVFSLKFFLWHTLDPEERKVYQGLIQIITEEIDQDTAKVITRELRLMEFNKEVEDAQNRYAVGEDIDLYERVRSCVTEYEQDVRKSVDSSYCTASIQEIIEESTQGTSLLWSLDCLNRSMPDLRTGKQILVGARPGKGKTSFVADQVVHFTRSPWVQRDKRPIVWFNNEGKKIMQQRRNSSGSSVDLICYRYMISMVKTMRTLNESLIEKDPPLSSGTCSIMSRVIQEVEVLTEQTKDLRDYISGAESLPLSMTSYLFRHHRYRLRGRDYNGFLTLLSRTPRLESKVLVMRYSQLELMTALGLTGVDSCTSLRLNPKRSLGRSLIVALRSFLTRLRVTI